MLGGEGCRSDRQIMHGRLKTPSVALAVGGGIPHTAGHTKTLNPLPTTVWQRRAACRGRLDLDWIDPSPTQETQCRTVCAGCPVRALCRTFALASGEPWGIWGGLDPDERASIARSAGYPPPRALPPHGTNARYAKHRCPCTPCRRAHTVYERQRQERVRRHA
jgi:Transcription factor WhiB